MESITMLEKPMTNPIQSPFTDQILDNLQFQGSSNDCGPYTTATVINALRGQNLVGDELANQMNKPRWRGIFPVIRRVPNWATLPWGLVDVFRDYDLRGRWWFRVPLSYLKPAGVKKSVGDPIRIFRRSGIDTLA